MNKIIFLYEDLDDLFYEVLRISSESKRIDCASISFTDFLKSQAPTLFVNNASIIFYNAQKLDSNLLVEFLEKDKSSNILAFYKIDKRTRLYKTVIKDYEPHICLPITTIVAKKDFIHTVMVEKGLGLNLIDYFMSVLPENKNIIVSEIHKFSEIFNKTRDIELAKKSICVYKGSIDIFELLNAFFEKSTTRYYHYLNKVVLESHPLQVYALLSKKILYLINLNLGDVPRARSYIFTTDYFIKKDTKLALKLGVKPLLKLHTYLDSTIGDVYYNKDLRTSLLDIYHYFSINSII
jgi:DNA polymerase III delta subunit